MENEVQKLDQAAIKKKQSILNTDLNSPISIFRTPPAVGAGTDERFPFVTVGDKLDAESEVLSKIELSYRKFSLLSDLSSGIYGSSVKMQKVRSGILQEILPSNILEVGITPINFHSGGLMKDWSFSME
jgi:hypothetical protein